MSMMVATQITDTARAATQVAMTAERSCVAYVRVVHLPACARCLILSGRQYSHSTGFQRHPRCDCGMRPMADRDWKATRTPEDMLREMTPEQQRRALGAAGVEALERGADLGQIVNARRGLSTATTGRGPVQVTTEGTTRRGIGGRALDAGFGKAEGGGRYERAREARLMPEAVLRLAGDDRERQIALLRKHGYIT
ncbi:hypothetical protein [Streptomyces huiliensis]|uniref:hypothetical protein n=1 Tax=Streptomyces huiliensis TaxID=2876027 RepID=UPI001CBD2BEF|nr:hypothetical protein [Streptomyces huiliensis]